MKTIPTAYTILKYVLLSSWIVPVITLLLVRRGLSVQVFLVSIFAPAVASIGALIYLKETDASSWARKEGFRVKHLYVISVVNLALTIVVMIALFLLIIAFSQRRLL